MNRYPTTRAANGQALLCAAAVFCAPYLVHAEAVWEQENTVDGYREVIRMTVTPAAEPVPAFKYRLTLLPHELVPGNSVAHYMRAFPDGFDKHWRYYRDEYGEELEEWHSGGVPISELPMDKFVTAATTLDDLVKVYVGPGSRCRETDWGVSFVDIRGPEIISFLLPEIQGMRSIGRAVALNTRLAIAEHRYDDAINLQRMNYRLGRDVGQQPILVSGLVGMAIIGITNANAIDLMAAPDSPNLYWALTELPRPQVSLREALRLEMAIGPRMFECLDNPEEKNLSHDEWNALWKRSARLTSEIDSSGSQPDSLASDFQPLFHGLRGYAHAKERLVAWGYDQDTVDAMAVGQVLSIYSARVYETVADEWEKAAYVDFPTGKRLYEHADEVIRRHDWQSDHADREIIPIAGMLLPAVMAAQKAAFRTERDLDALRVIEALRMHAAENDGQWPESLGDITCVPVPDNVATGQPFEYHVRGDTAVLLLPMSDGFGNEKQYELKVATQD